MLDLWQFISPYMVPWRTLQTQTHTPSSSFPPRLRDFTSDSVSVWLTAHQRRIDVPSPDEVQGDGCVATYPIILSSHHERRKRWDVLCGGGRDEDATDNHRERSGRERCSVGFLLGDYRRDLRRDRRDETLNKIEMTTWCYIHKVFGMEVFDIICIWTYLLLFFLFIKLNIWIELNNRSGVKIFELICKTDVFLLIICMYVCMDG